MWEGGVDTHSSIMQHTKSIAIELGVLNSSQIID